MIIKKALKDKTSMNTIYPETSADQVKGIESVVAKLPTDEEGNIILSAPQDKKIIITNSDKSRKLIIDGNDFYIQDEDNTDFMSLTRGQTYLYVIKDDGTQYVIVDGDNDRILFMYPSMSDCLLLEDGLTIYDEGGITRATFKENEYVKFEGNPRGEAISLRSLYKHNLTFRGIDVDGKQFYFSFDYINDNPSKIVNGSFYSEYYCVSVASGKYDTFDIIRVSPDGIHYLNGFTEVTVSWGQLHDGSLTINDNNIGILTETYEDN